MGSKNDSVVIGYWYSMNIHAVVCHGPVDAVKSLVAGERVAWSGNVTSNADVEVQASELFGGEAREGGLRGYMQVMMGEPDQPVNDLIAAKRGDVPAYRGLLSVFFRSVDIFPLYVTSPALIWAGIRGNLLGYDKHMGNGGFVWSAMNPYIKPFWLKVRHITKDRPWYTAKAAIGDDMNPAHIIYDVLTNRKYGLGFSSTLIDDAAFRAAADALYAEGFGISMMWQGATRAWDFIEQVIDHVNGAFYLDPATGLFKFKLIRDDYDEGSVLVLDASNIASFNSFERAAWGEITNQVTLSYTNPETEKETSVTLQNPAAVAAQGNRIINTEVSLPGIRSAELAMRCALRHLHATSAPLAKASVEVNRAAYNLRPGDVVKLNWAPLGISNMLMRVGEVEFGTATDSRIKLDIIEDAFGLPSTVYTAPQVGGWADPVTAPVAITQQRVMEASYYEVNRKLAPSIIADLDPAFGFGKPLALRPSSNVISYQVTASSTAGGDYEVMSSGTFPGSATLGVEVGKTDTQFTLAAISGMQQTLPGALCYLDDEMLAYQGYDTATGKHVFIRGVMDTVPGGHGVGAVMYIDIEGISIDETERLNGETVYYKLLSKNGLGTLPSASATTLPLTLARRYQRPYAPGNVKLNGLVYPAEIEGLTTATWSHRDRTQQTVGIATQAAGNIGPEAGTTYSWRVIRLDTNAVVESDTGVTGTSVAFTATYRGNVRFELWSVRDGLDSYQRQQHDFYWANASRITEAGDTRITENGDTRLLEY